VYIAHLNSAGVASLKKLLFRVTEDGRPSILHEGRITQGDPHLPPIDVQAMSETNRQVHCLGIRNSRVILSVCILTIQYIVRVVLLCAAISAYTSRQIVT
jgi:hypothetical protein